MSHSSLMMASQERRLRKELSEYRELQSLFSCAGFLLRKWNSNDLLILQHIPSKQRDISTEQEIDVSDVSESWEASGMSLETTFISQLKPCCILTF